MSALPISWMQYGFQPVTEVQDVDTFIITPLKRLIIGHLLAEEYKNGYLYPHGNRNDFNSR